MRVLITGATGQLGQALQRAAPDQLCDEPLDLYPVGRSELDLIDASACRRMVNNFKPDWLINAAAYTAVDLAEAEPDLAWAVNASAPAALADALAENGGRMLQLSTDFVFNGKQGFPYLPDQPVDPLGVYGASKAEGERAVMKLLGPECRGHVLRTSWVYGAVGKNFLLTMLRLHRERQQIHVVADQVGCPTSSTSLALACWHLLERATHQIIEIPAVLHWSDAGVASWYDFAVAIAELAQSTGLIEKAARIVPISTQEYPTPAVRPSYSLLECTSSREFLKLTPAHWRDELARVLLHLR